MNDARTRQEAAGTAFVQSQLADLIERDRILARLTELFVATDAKQWDRVVRCFAPVVAFDMSSVGSGPPAPTRAADIIAGWRAALDPIQAVHHQAGNYVIRVSGTHAEAFCYGIAYHHRVYRDGRSTHVFVGSYDFGLERVEDAGETDWQITMMRFTLKFMDGKAGREAAE